MKLFKRIKQSTNTNRKQLLSFILLLVQKKWSILRMREGGEATYPSALAQCLAHSGTQYLLQE